MLLIFQTTHTHTRYLFGFVPVKHPVHTLQVFNSSVANKQQSLWDLIFGSSLFYHLDLLSSLHAFRINDQFQEFNYLLEKYSHQTHFLISDLFCCWKLPTLFLNILFICFLCLFPWKAKKNLSLSVYCQSLSLFFCIDKFVSINCCRLCIGWLHLKSFRGYSGGPFQPINFEILVGKSSVICPSREYHRIEAINLYGQRCTLHVCTGDRASIVQNSPMINRLCQPKEGKHFFLINSFHNQTGLCGQSRHYLFLPSDPYLKCRMANPANVELIDTTVRSDKCIHAVGKDSHNLVFSSFDLFLLLRIVAVKKLW